MPQKGKKSIGSGVYKRTTYHLERLKGRRIWNKGLKGWTKGTKAGFQKGHKGFGTKESYSRAGLKKSGENSGTWEGGRWNYFKKQAKIRDNYICQICGINDPDVLEVDHIKQKCDFPELRCLLDNLITLCANCHRKRTSNFLRERFKK